MLVVVLFTSVLTGNPDPVKSMYLMSPPALVSATSTPTLSAGVLPATWTILSAWMVPNLACTPAEGLSAYPALPIIPAIGNPCTVLKSAIGE
jgi:hypothetical protein